MALSEADAQGVLKQLIDPNTGQDNLATRTARNIKVVGNDVSLDIELGYPAKTQIEPVRKEVTAKLGALPGVGNVNVNIHSKIVSHAVQRGVKLSPGVKN